MDNYQEETQKRKTHYTISDLSSELDVLRKTIEESSTKEEILNYLEERITELKKTDTGGTL